MCFAFCLVDHLDSGLAECMVCEYCWGLAFHHAPCVLFIAEQLFHHAFHWRLSPPACCSQHFLLMHAVDALGDQVDQLSLRGLVLWLFQLYWHFSCWSARIMSELAHGQVLFLSASRV